MQRFRQFLAEMKKTTTEERLAKKYVVSLANKKKKKITESSRGGFHVRFPIKGSLAEVQAFFRGTGITVSRAATSKSGKYETFDLLFIKPVSGVPANTRIAYVNNVAAGKAGGEVHFKTKELTPDRLGLAGKELTINEIISHTKKALGTSQYHPDIIEWLNDLLIVAGKSRSPKVAIKNQHLAKSDLATVSKDFGEIISAVWAIKNLKFNRIFFPSAINEPLVDFYGVSGRTRYPVSVKSGGGSGTSIGNVMNRVAGRMDDPKFKSQFNPTEWKLIEMMKIIHESPVVPGILKAHQFLSTKAIGMVAKTMGVGEKAITAETIEKFIAKHDLEEVQEMLEPFYNHTKRRVSQKTWDDIESLPKKYGVIVSPLGYHLMDLLNNNQDYINTLTKLVSAIDVLQLNVDVYAESMSFKFSKFRESKFKFDYHANAKSPAQNKFGFKKK